MARGGGWMSFRANADDGKGKATVVELKPNMTGFHAVQLKLCKTAVAGGAAGMMGMFSKKAAPAPAPAAAAAAGAGAHPQALQMVSQHTDKQRFNLYKDTEKECTRFCSWVDKLPKGRVVLICITDTAMAASRPLPKRLYTALAQLGAPENMEPIGYLLLFLLFLLSVTLFKRAPLTRSACTLFLHAALKLLLTHLSTCRYRMPFAMIGVKGAKQGSVVMAMDKTKVLLRLEAEVYQGGEGGGEVLLRNTKAEKVDVTETILKKGN
jgi:hypothetical protein